MYGRPRVMRGGAPVLALLVLAAYYVGPGTASAAQLQRKVHLATAMKQLPVAVTKVTLGGATVQAGRFARPATEAADADTPFPADDNSFQNLDLYVLNRTSRTIAFLALQFHFPEADSAFGVAGFQISLGRMPASANFDYYGKPLPPPSADSRSLSLGPGATMVIHLGDYVSRANATLERTVPLAALTALDVAYLPVVFEGGLEWNAGYRVFDAVQSKWLPLGRNYFPGEMNARWPGTPGWADPR